MSRDEEPEDSRQRATARVRFELAFGEVLPALLCRARSELGNEADAREVVQETGLSAWRGLEDFRGECSFRTWTWGILRNKIADHYRKAQRRPVTSPLDAAFPDGESGEVCRTPRHLPAAQDDVEETVYNQLRGEELTAMLDALPDQLGDVVRLIVVEKRTYRQTADELGMTYDVVRGRYAQALVRLRALLESEEGDQ